MRVQILKIHKKDAFFLDSDKLIGEIGELIDANSVSEHGYTNAHIKLDGNPVVLFFYAVKYKEIK